MTYIRIVIALLLTTLSCFGNSVPVPTVENGVIDLSQWNFDNDGNVSLDGEWFFRWNQFVGPQSIDFSSSGWESIQVPGQWKYIPSLTDSLNLYDKGAGTFVLKIKGLSSNTESLMLKMHEIRTAYNLFIIPLGDVKNRTEIKPDISVGIPSVNPKTAVSQYKPVLLPLNEEIDSCFLVMHVSNFTMKHGGIKSSLILGTEQQVRLRHENVRLMHFMILGIFLILFFYHFSIFFNHRTNRASLALGLFCIAEFFCIALSEWYPVESIKNPSNTLFSYHLKLTYFSFVLAMPLFVSFIHLSFPNELDAKVHKLIWAITCLFSLTFLLPLFYVEKLYGWYQYFILMVITYVFISIIRAVIHKRTGAVTSFIGYMILFVTVINDVLYDQHIIYTMWLVPYGQVAFIFFQSYMLAKQSAKAFNDVEYLKENLELEVKRKTQELHDAHDAIKKESIARTYVFANLAHETKTPLTIIKNNLERFIRKNGVSGELQEIHFNVNTLLVDMVNFLDAEKIMLGKILYQHNTIVNVSDFLKRKVQSYEETARHRDVSIISNIEENIVFQIDPSALDRIFNNLLDNAIKYNTDDGKVFITLKESNSGTILEISDTGIGIPAEKVTTIFEPFYQAAHKKRNSEGVGMGLYITKQILDEIEGKIEVISSVGVGTTFSITFLKSDTTPEDEVIKVDFEEHLESAYTMAIEDFYHDNDVPALLCIEDNRALLSDLREALCENYTVLCAKNGNDALRKLEASQYTPSLIISDVMMDEMDGYEFYRTISQNDDYFDTPFIFLTARSTEHEQIEALSMGAVDYMYKPFSMDVLLAKVKTLVEYHSLQKSLVESEKFRSIGVLTASVSHEILNPLMGIKGPLNVLKKQLPLDGENKKITRSLSYIEENVARISDTVDTIRALSTSSIDTTEKVVLKDFLTPILTLIDKSKPQGITIDTKIIDNIELTTNCGALSRILINLIENALDAIQGDGVVTISAEQTFDAVTLIVSDTGCGIDDKTVSRIFDFAFTTKEHGKGTGIGLFIVHSLVEKIGAHILVSSKVGAGTSFTIRVPAKIQ